jgi:hypothetical protein
MREMNPSSRLLGFVQLRVGDRVIAVPVQAMKLAQDGGRQPGGFYATPGELGIYVDDKATAAAVADQIRSASDEAAQHFGRRYLN